MIARKIFVITFLFLLLVGCAGVAVREPVKVDLSLPVGKIEENQFTGIRYPFRVSAPPNWKVTMEIPNFMEELGYERPGLEESQLFIFNPSTESSLQIDFTPANPRFAPNQGVMEALVSMGTSSLRGEWEKEGVRVEVGPTEAATLRGVQYAAKKYVTYTLNGVKREQGWVYGFSEPYQIFILYMILEKEGANDREDMKKILDSFEYVRK